MESDFLDEINKRFVRSFLDYVILMELLKRPLGSHDVITVIDNRHHTLLSSSTVYTCLYALERDGLVKIELNTGKRVCSLTERGKETAREFLEAKAKIMGLLLDLFANK